MKARLQGIDPRTVKWDSLAIRMRAQRPGPPTVSTRVVPRVRLEDGLAPQSRAGLSGSRRQESSCRQDRLTGAFLCPGESSEVSQLTEANGLLTRRVGISRTRSGDRAIKATLSSEAPAHTYSPSYGGECIEILDHSPGAIDLSRAQGGGFPLLTDHNPHEIPPPGRVEKLSLSGRRLRGHLRFGSSARAAEVWEAITEGLLSGLSVGYRWLNWNLEGKDEATGLPIVRVTKWALHEVSLVNVPADASVGIGRSLQMTEQNTDAGADRAQRTRFAQITRDFLDMAGSCMRSSGPANGVAIFSAAEREYNRVLADDRLSAQDAGDAIGRAILREQEALQNRHGRFGQPSSESLDADFAAMSRQDRGRYSVARAINQAVELKMDRRSRYDGLEGEVHQELMRTRPKSAADHGGILIPLTSRSESDWSARTLGTMEATGGASTVGQMVMPEIIDLLRNRTQVLASGARLQTGLQGVLYFNKAAADPTVHWMEENPAADVDGSEPAYGYVALSPKTLIGQVQVPRQLLTQASFDVESDIRMRLGNAHALALDLAALHGQGTDKVPLGIWNTPDVQFHPVGGVPDLEDVVTMPALIADKNADLGSLAWMTTPLMAGVLMRTPVVAENPLMLWGGSFQQGVLGGFPARATNQVSKTLGAGSNEHGLLFGNWADLMVGMWGNDLEIVVDVYSKAARGQILITSYSMADCAVLRPESFCKGTGATIS